MITKLNTEKLHTDSSTAVNHWTCTLTSWEKREIGKNGNNRFLEDGEEKQCWRFNDTVQLILFQLALPQIVIR